MSRSKVRPFAAAHALGVERMRALEPHRAVHEPERLGCLGVAGEQRQTFLDPARVARQ